ncbi:MAG: WD40/YVTN/BNR-like repeat-containing protein [Acidimicrobiales bacterium]
MPETDIADLLALAARHYRPDAAGALAQVRTRAARGRRRRTRSLASAVVVLAAVVVGATVTVLGSSMAPSGPSSSVLLPPTSELAAASETSNGLVDLTFSSSGKGLGLERRCAVVPTADTVCSLAVVRTSDGGRDWRPAGRALHVRYPHSRASYPFIDFATNGQDAWIYGSETFVSRDGGRSFTRDDPGGIVSDLSIVGNETWALRRPCPPAVPGCVSRIITVPSAGGRWSPQRSAPELSYPYLQLLRPSGTAAFLAAEATDGTVEATDDGGASWTYHLLPPLCGELDHLAATSPRQVWALCTASAPAEAQAKQLYRSSDAGGRWTLVATTGPGAGGAVGSLPVAGVVTGLTAPAPGYIWIVLDHGPVLASDDGGRTWTEQSLPGGAEVDELTFTDARHGWALVAPGATLDRTSDGGRTWDEVGPR